MTNTKQIDRTQALAARKVKPFENQPTRRQKKNHQNFATLQQPKAESGLSKQLLSNFQAKKLCDRKQLEAEVKNAVTYKTSCS